MRRLAPTTANEHHWEHNTPACHVQTHRHPSLGNIGRGALYSARDEQEHSSTPIACTIRLAKRKAPYPAAGLKVKDASHHRRKGARLPFSGRSDTKQLYTSPIDKLTVSGTAKGEPDGLLYAYNEYNITTQNGGPTSLG